MTTITTDRGKGRRGSGRRQTTRRTRAAIPALRALDWIRACQGAMGLCCLGTLLVLTLSTTPASSRTPVAPAHAAGAGSAAGSISPRWWDGAETRDARYGHTATRLRDGRVLVAGGVDTYGRAELYDPRTGAWTDTGRMRAEQFDYTATLLPDGRVLAAGGQGVALFGRPGAEVYDPRTGRWSVTGRMVTTRYGHTATPLRTGQVLVASGYDVHDQNGDNAVPVASAELYDPRAGTWRATGRLHTARAHGTATLLPDGRVLVAGGSAGSRNQLGAAFASAEVYDPRAGRWSVTGAMTVARQDHTATLLPDGRVLVAGGVGKNGHALASAEVYDPRSGRWTTTGVQRAARALHTATLLPGGRVLVAGGTGATTATAFSTTALSSAEFYDPRTGVWTPAGRLDIGRYGHTATRLPTGAILIVGGVDATGAYVARAAVFAITAPHLPPSPGHWTVTASMRHARFAPTATLLRTGQVLVAGGGGPGPATAELYDPYRRTWARTGRLRDARYFHTATLLSDGRVLIAGGQGAQRDTLLARAETYDPRTGAWTRTGRMRRARYQHTATLLRDGRVLVAGGRSDNVAVLRGAEIYDPRTGRWTRTGSMHIVRAFHTATRLRDGTILVAGGVTELGTAASAEIYDPGAGAWRVTGAMRAPRTYHTATLLPSGEVLVTGGSNVEIISDSSAELYDPRTGAWRATEHMRVGRTLHTATLLPTGQVLVLGSAQFLNADSAAPLANAELYRQP